MAVCTASRRKRRAHTCTFANYHMPEVECRCSAVTLKARKGYFKSGLSISDAPWLLPLVQAAFVLAIPVRLVSGVCIFTPSLWICPNHAISYKHRDELVQARRSHPVHPINGLPPAELLYSPCSLVSDSHRLSPLPHISV